MNIDAMISISAMLLLGFLFFGPWQELCTAYARQVMFEKRDAIFDLARYGEIDFGSENYKNIRSSLEKLIRFSHELTLGNFLIVNYFSKRYRPERVGKSKLRRSINSVEKIAVREQIERLTFEAHEAALIMMLARSIFTVWFVPFLLVVRNWGSEHEHLASFAMPFGETVQFEAENAPVNAKMAA